MSAPAHPSVNRAIEAISALRLADPIDVDRAIASIEDLRDVPLSLAIRILLPALVARAWPRPLLARASHEAGAVRVADAAETAIARRIAQLRPTEIATLDAHARARRWWHTGSHWSRWVELELRDVARVREGRRPTTVLEGMLSQHPDGRLRASAVDALAGLGIGSLPWLLVRTIDWASAVRARAVVAVEVLVQDPASLEVAVASLPLLARLANYARADTRALRERVLASVLSDPDRFVRTVARNGDATVRRSALDLLDRTGMLGPAALAALRVDRDPGVRRRAATALAQRWRRGERSAIARADLEAWTRDRTGSVRALALEAIVATGDAASREAAVRMLDDPDRAVRALARGALGSSVDVAAFYRDIVDRSPTVGAIEGLAEARRGSDWERVVPALDRTGPLACAALRALRVLDRASSRDLRAMMCLDARAKVAAAAVRTMRSDVWASDEPWIREAVASPHAHVRRGAVELAVQLPGWLPAFVLLGSTDPVLAPRISRALRSWARKRFVRGASASRAEADALATAIGGSHVLDERARAELLAVVAQVAR